MLTETDRLNILENNAKNSGMNVRAKTQRFPMVNGVHRKVCLLPKVTGVYMNIAFVAGIENTIYGHIADELLLTYPDYFIVISIDGKKTGYVEKKNEAQMIKEEIMNSLKKDYDLVPKQRAGGDSARQRPQEKEITSHNNNNTK